MSSSNVVKMLGLVALAVTMASGAELEEMEACAASPYQIPFASHSHNDYEQARPLFLALDNGMCSIEADFFYVNGTFLVAHEPTYITPERTLQALYLDPLTNVLAANGGDLYPAGRYFGGCNPPILMLDVKNWDGTEEGADSLGAPPTAEQIYDAVHELLLSYNEAHPGTFTVFAENNVTNGAVMALVSGARPSAEHVTGKGTWIGALDLQEPENLTTAASTAVYPLFSIGMDSVVGRDVNDAAELTPEDMDKLQELVDKAHSQGRMARYWATPDTPEMWQILFDLDLDLIGTDTPLELREFVFCHPATMQPAAALYYNTTGSDAVAASSHDTR